MPKYRKKPVVIEDPVQFKYREYADNPLVFDSTPDWLQEAIDDGRIVPEFGGEDYWYLSVETLNGRALVGPDEWIIRGVQGELYPCKPDIFDATYEEVNDSNG